MKINYGLVSRSLIALLFVVAGIQKILHFGDTVTAITAIHVPFAVLATLIVIIVEVPVALAFAWGYRVCIMGWTLVAYTVLVTILVHGNLQGINLIMALKNIAIIGGILLATHGCDCGVCPPSKKKMGHPEHNHQH